MGKAEEDQHVFSAEIAVSDRLAVLVDEGEGTADQSRASRLDLWSLRAAGEDQRTSATEGADEKPGKDHYEQAAAHLFAQLEKRAVDPRARKEPAEDDIADEEVHSILRERPPQLRRIECVVQQ